MVSLSLAFEAIEIPRLAIRGALLARPIKICSSTGKASGSQQSLLLVPNLVPTLVPRSRPLFSFRQVSVRQESLSMALFANTWHLHSRDFLAFSLSDVASDLKAVQEGKDSMSRCKPLPARVGQTVTSLALLVPTISCCCIACFNGMTA